MEDKNGRTVVMVLMLAFFVWLMCSIRSCFDMVRNDGDTINVRVDSVIDTVRVVVHDTIPQVRYETVIGQVAIPLSAYFGKKDTTSVDTLSEIPRDSAYLDVVQKKYSDDSTYVAYVSGLKYADWPRLDSVNVFSSIIVKEVTKTITLQKKKNRFHIGLQAGYGYGLRSTQFEPYIGFGVSYNIY